LGEEKRVELKMLSRFKSPLWNAGRRLFKGFGRRSPNQGIILLYHRVAEPPRDPQLLAVAPDRFADHLSVLKECARPVALDEMLARVSAGTPLPPRAVAITFDDGYSDNALNAEPLLTEAGIPATLFVATGFCETGQPYWWDAIETAVLEKLCSSRLDLPFPEGMRSWTVTTLPHGRDGWNVLDDSEPNSRRSAYREIIAATKPLGISARDRLIDTLRRATDCDLAAKGEARPMSPMAISNMHRRGVITIGAHTVNHPQLSNLSASEQEWEITQSSRSVAQWTGCPAGLFAYPYGSKADYNSHSIEIVAGAGFRASCSNFPGLVDGGAARLELPRVLVRNLNAADFANMLNAAFASEY
jgi:peptidoglycan/xylan/chitin deacetylase (PgdA/CDA1 family)